MKKVVKYIELISIEAKPEETEAKVEEKKAEKPEEKKAAKTPAKAAPVKPGTANKKK